MKKWGIKLSMLMVICVLVSSLNGKMLIDFFYVEHVEAVSPNSGSDTVEKYIALQYQTPNTAENEIITSCLAEDTETTQESKRLQNDPIFTAEYDSWATIQFVTGDASGIKNMFSKKDLYIAMILKLLEDTQSSGITPIAEIKTIDQLIDDGINQLGYDRSVLNSNSQQAKKLLSYIEGKLVNNGMSHIPIELKNTIKNGENIASICDRYAKYQSLYYTSENVKEVLKKLKAAASKSMDGTEGFQDLNPIYRDASNFMEAIDAVLIKCNEQFTPEQFISQITLSDIAVETGTLVVSALINVVAKGTLAGQALELIRSYANLAFSSDVWFDAVTNMMSYSKIEEWMKCVAQEELRSYNASPTHINAMKLIYSINFLYQTKQTGLQYSSKYWDAIRTSNYSLSFDPGSIELADSKLQYIATKIQDYQEEQEILENNWKKTLKKENQTLYNYFFNIQYINDSRGDDGEVNWNFISPVNHRKEIPDGWIPIYTADDLNRVRNNLFGHYILMNDINLENWENWDPIGNGSYKKIDDEDEFNQYKRIIGSNWNEGLYSFDGEAFYGITSSTFDSNKSYYLQNRFYGFFEGNGYTIRNLKIGSTTTDYIGLFGYASRARLLDLNYYDSQGIGYSETSNISNLFIEDVNFDIQINERLGESIYVGGLAGRLDAQIKNCNVSGTIKVDIQLDPELYPTINLNFISGVAGAMYSNGSNYLENDVLDCSNQADVTVYTNQQAYISGIATNTTYTPKISNSFNSGNIEGYAINAFSNDIGVRSAGITAWSPSGSVERCANLGRVTSYAKAPGFQDRTSEALAIGDVKNQIDCYNSGEVNSKVYGFLPYTKQVTIMAKAQGLGTIYPYFNSVKNSISLGRIFSCYKVYDESGNVKEIGNSYRTITDDYTDDTQKNYIFENGYQDVGVSVSYSQLSDKAAFKTLDFEKTWAIDIEKNNGRPFLRNLLPGLRESSNQPVTPEIPGFYNIKWNGSGGILPSDPNLWLYADKIISGSKIYYVDEYISKENHTFLGWYTAKEGGTKITHDTVPTSDTTYYAQWSANVTGVRLAPNDITLEEGQEIQLQTTIEPDEAVNKDVSYNSSDWSVAYVDENGKIIAGYPGVATITVTSNDGFHSAETVITVTGKNVH